MSKHFDSDLADGKIAEDAFARILLSGRELWEHKRDFQCITTGNIALEYQTSTLPHGRGERYDSGIAICRAYWFVIEFADERRHVLPTDAVKELARLAIGSGLHKWIGDNNRFHNALVPLKWFWARPEQEAGWEDTLPTLKQARDYVATGTFKPDPDGWTTSQREAKAA